MGLVVIDMSMSLDGYIAAPNDRPGQGLGEDAKAQEVAGDKRIGIMGADIGQQFLAAGLVNEIRIHLIDVLLGGGRRLFDTLPRRVELKQTESYEAGGVTHIGYRVIP